MIVAKKLHTAIETFHIPVAIQKRVGKKRMGRVFRDAEELPLSSDLGADIEKALDNSEWFIAICSPEYLKSKWCMRELEYYIEHHGLDHVLAVLVDGEPDESFPDILRNGINSMGEEVQTEPLAADIRDDSINKRLHRLSQEKLRLIAPMLSVSYDDLKRRARQRRVRVALSVAAVSLAVGSGIATYVIASNKRAEKLRQEAEEQRIQAEIERKTAASNSIGELMEKASSYLVQDERRKAAASLLDATKISKANDDMRHDEIVALLRRVVYIAPYTAVSSLSDHNLDLTNISVSSDEHYAIGIENGNTLVLIDLVTNELQYRVASGESSEMISYAEFSPDGERFLAICGEGRSVKVWNTSDGSQAFIYNNQKKKSNQIANAHFWKGSDTLFVQDDNAFYILSSDGEKSVFYTIGDQQEGYSYSNTVFDGINLRNYYSNTNQSNHAAMDVVLSNDGAKVLVSGMFGETGTIILDERGEKICLLERMPGTFAEKYTFSPDGMYVTCISKFGFLATWDTFSGKFVFFQSVAPEATFSNIISRVAYSPDGDHFSFVFQDALYQVDVSGKEPVARTNFVGDKASLPHAVYSKDGNYIFVTYENLYVLDAHDCRCISMMTGDHYCVYDNCIPLCDTVLVSQFARGAKLYSLPSISSVTYADSFSGKLLDYYDPSKIEKQWNTYPKGDHQLSEAAISTFSGSFANLNAALFYSQDGETAALTYPDGIIEIFNRTRGGNVVDVIKPFSIWMTWDKSLAIDHRFLLASGGANQLLLYDLEKRTVKKEIQARFTYAGFAFDERGKYFMGKGVGGYGIVVYSLETLEELFWMERNDEIEAMAFSLDGAYAVGKTDRGYLIGDMLLDEDDVLSHAHRLVSAVGN